ncbi:DUF7373 family lipoprotein [Nocardia carnea]|uniref:DUF7373 family lipoprotein n=1 Tax=Nocardia carnea TaxID=37328 RepID=UPI002454B99C|nr:hypothetical protein [Nocardia carnea]
MLATAVLATVVSGCGSVVQGEAVRAKPDLSDLDVGNYSTEPFLYGTAADGHAARYREAQRLGDFVALPFEADPAYVTRMMGMGGPVVLDRRDMRSLVINDTFDEVAADLIAGWVHTWSTGGDAGTAQQMSIAVLMFPDAAIAEDVAAGLEHDDFTFNIDNRPVQLPAYPHSKAHWRPGIASLGSWTSHDRYVIFVKYNDLSGKTDLPSMVQRTEALLDVQIPLLDRFEPTPAEQLSDIELDPDSVLAVALPKSEALVATTGPASAFRGRGSLYALSGIENLDFLDKGQVTAIGLAESVVMRSRSTQGAEFLLKNFEPSGEGSQSTPIESPEGITDGEVRCYSRKLEQWETRPSNFCLFQTGRYFAQVEGSQIQDLHQKTSAQYALLAR